IEEGSLKVKALEGEQEANRQMGEALERETKISNKLQQALGDLKIKQEQTDAALAQEKRAAYFNRIVLADRELAANRVDMAERLLDGCPKELQHFEWRWLKRLCHTEARVVPLADWAGTPGSFSPDGKSFVSLSADHNVRIWDLATGKASITLDKAYPSWNSGPAFSPDGKRLAWLSHTGAMKVWEISKPPTEGIRDVAQLFPANTGAPIKIDRSVFAALVNRSLTFNPDGSRLAFIQNQLAVQVWDVDNARSLHAFNKLKSQFHGIAFSSDGKKLAIGSGVSQGPGGDVTIVDLTTGKASRTFRAHTTAVHGVAFSPDGKSLATCAIDRL